MLVQDSESQEDQYLFEICPVEHSVQNCHQIAISCVSIHLSQFTACPARNLNIALYLIGGDVLVKSTESQDAQNHKTGKPSTSTVEKIQDESSAHEESSSSDQD